MTSIQDVANQINNKLDQINNNGAATVAVGNGIRSDLAQANTKLDGMDAHLQNGFSQVNNKLDALDYHLQADLAGISNGLFAVWELQKVTNSILENQSEQNKTIICLLNNSNELLCGMTRKLTHQLDISEQLLISLKRVEGIAERSHPAEAGDYDRLGELNKKILACCPPEAVPEESCPPGCPVDEIRVYHPKGQDWTPQHPPDHPIE